MDTTTTGAGGAAGPVQPPPGMDIAVAATPARRPGMHGGTPGAKRPTALEGLLAGAPSAGPPMDAEALNNFVYKLYYDMEAMKKWAFTVNEGMNDHAARLDGARLEAKAGAKVEETQADLERTKIDVKGMLQQISENDAAVKAIIDGVMRDVSNEVSTLKAAELTLQQNVDEKVRIMEHSIKMYEQQFAAALAGHTGTTAPETATATPSQTSRRRSP